MRLHHLHIPYPIPYLRSLRIQDVLVQRHLTDKDRLRHDPSLTSAAPPPTLLTFQTIPTYTVGRRHLNANPLSPEQIAFLKGHDVLTSPAYPERAPNIVTLADFFATPRGGLLTYHGPGQLTAYLILNLRTHSLSPRCYIHMLEQVVRRTCTLHHVPNTTTDPTNPGVWIAERNKTYPLIAPVTPIVPTTRKICAVGVHVSRGITSHGIGLNLFDHVINPLSPRRPFYTLPAAAPSPTPTPTPTAANVRTPLAPGYLSWGFSRITACGIPSATATWMAAEQQSWRRRSSLAPMPHLYTHRVAHTLAGEIAGELGVKQEDIEDISLDSVDGEAVGGGPNWEELRDAEGW